MKISTGFSISNTSMAVRGIWFEDKVRIQEMQSPVSTLCKDNNDGTSVFINVRDLLIS
jgi:hypothetical protein